jgi:hypothetical protein
VDWFIGTISAHPFVVLLLLFGMGLGLLLARDRLLKISGLPREAWPRYFSQRTITPAGNKLGFFILCVCGLGRVLIGVFEQHHTFGKLVYIGEGLALVLAAFIIYRRTQRDIERAVTTPIDPNQPSGGAM